MKKWIASFLWYLHGYNFAWAVRFHTAEASMATVDFTTEHKARSAYNDTALFIRDCVRVELLHAGTVIETRALTTEHQ